MVVKTYKTYFLKSLVTDFEKEDGKVIHVVFKGGIHFDSTARYTTSDPYIQKCLENSRMFGADYYIESEQVLDEGKDKAEEKKPETPVQEEKPLTDMKDYRRFHNLVEMRNYMAELGFEGVQEMNYMAAKAAAAKEGYDFQIQK